MLLFTLIESADDWDALMMGEDRAWYLDAACSSRASAGQVAEADDDVYTPYGWNIRPPADENYPLLAHVEVNRQPEFRRTSAP